MQVYADNAATTRMSDKAVAAMLPYFQTYYGNPSSLHTVGQQAAEALADARRRAADRPERKCHPASSCRYRDPPVPFRWRCGGNPPAP